MVNFVEKNKLRAHHFFIPCKANNHRPHFVHHRALRVYSASFIFIKVFVLCLVFIVAPSQAEFSTVTTNRIIELTNQAREEEGLPALRHNRLLDSSANLKAGDMVKNDYFAHDSPQGVKPWEWFKEAGYNYTFAGENLAMNFSEAEEAMQAWLDSPTHRENLLSPKYTEIGVSVIVGNVEGRQTTIVVQHFGHSFTSDSSSRFQPSFSGIEANVAGSTEVSGGEAVEVTFREVGNRKFVSQFVFYAKKFFLILVVFVVINLILTIVVRIRTQHKPVILHTLVVIAIGIMAIFFNPHFFEAVAGEAIKIM